MDCRTPGFPVLPVGTLTKKASSSWTFLLPIFRENFLIFGFFLITGRKHTPCIPEDNKFCPNFWPWGNHCWSSGVYPFNLSQGRIWGQTELGLVPAWPLYAGWLWGSFFTFLSFYFLLYKWHYYSIHFIQLQGGTNALELIDVSSCYLYQCYT